jgi:hypothetical protein
MIERMIDHHNPIMLFYDIDDDNELLLFQHYNLQIIYSTSETEIKLTYQLWVEEENRF